MYVIVEQSLPGCRGYISDFSREGVASISLMPNDFRGWLSSAPSEDIAAVRGFVIGDLDERKLIAKAIRHYSPAPIFAMLEGYSLDETIDLLSSNFDDVFLKAVHVKEILAKSHAVWRRVQAAPNENAFSDDNRLRVFFNGRDIEVDGEVVVLPRRERQILEFLIENRSKRVTRSQIFSSIYGVFDNEVDETAVESHMSRLRKRLRSLLGLDPIDAKRFLGYQYQGVERPQVKRQSHASYVC